ncbi:MAG: pyridoxine 5'-phosphate synthase [Deltaproteobacteria bacterium]|nr:pyridoxine 5'-phosphate synthase [Deltaproteobacteria bacterium]MBW2417771.1 pyridoxine 5'-phosphate synthase [Deltaproteobacteria bacterium]
MRQLSLVLDSLPALREATVASGADLAAAANLAELAGAFAVRLGITEELRPVKESDVRELRAFARRFELCMPATQGLLKVALELRPDRVLLSAEGWEGRGAAVPIDLRLRPAAVATVLRTLEEAGLSVAIVVAPELDAVKAAQGLGAREVEIFTGSIVDLPPAERRHELEGLGDAVRLASKLRLGIGVGGGLGFDSVSEVLESAPASRRVSVGRALLRRSLLIGLDRAIRDFRALVD